MAKAIIEKTVEADAFQGTSIEEVSLKTFEQLTCGRKLELKR